MNKIFTALCLLLSLNTFSQTTYFVNDNASGAGNGSSWTDAFVKLQDALTAADSSDQVWVAEGTYYPDEGGGMTNDNRAHSFHLKNGVAIYGGFAGTETLLSERNVAANITSLSGEIQQDNDSTNNAYHVVQSSSVDSTAVLDGFTITAGNANGANFPDKVGGGMLNSSSSPTLTNCSFSGNTAMIQGGGIRNDSSSPTLTNCIFSRNSAVIGGGILNSNSSPILTNCSFSGNIAIGSGGGGIFNGRSSPTLTNCSFSGNIAIGSGGGGIFNGRSSPTLTNCSFSGNIAIGGGGIYNLTSSFPTLTNCSFSRNSADFGGGIVNDGSSSTLTNCILWGNSVGEIYNEFQNEQGSSAVVTYSIVQGGYPGTGNLDLDPLFVNAANGDLHLQASSPAIDAGLNSANTTSVDLDGNPRIVNGTIDMGAYEFQGEGLVVSSFTLINADTNEELGELRDGDTLNLAALPTQNLKIRGNTTPAIVGSVVFDLDGTVVVENIKPYRLGGELSTGQHTLTATPYSEARGGGTAGTPLTINFYVLYQVVNSFTLVNYDTNEDIMPLQEGDVINLATLPTRNLKIRANTAPAIVGSVVFNLDGSIVTENIRPYRYGVQLSVGQHTLTATPYSGANGSGHQGAGLSISFSVVNTLPITGIMAKPTTDAALEVRGSLKAAPNPSRGQSTISFSVPQSGFTILEVVDQRGAVVERLYAAQAEIGQVYTLPFDSKQLKSGVYVLRLTSGNYVQSYKLMLTQ